MTDIEGQVGDKPVDRRAQDGAVEVELGCRAVRDRLLVGSGCRVAFKYGVLARLVGDRDRRQLGAPRGLLRGVLHIRLAGGDSRVGHGEGPRVAFPIDDEQHVAFVDELVVLDPEIVDKAGYVRRDRFTTSACTRASRVHGENR